MNEHSSRSHALFNVTLEQREEGRVTKSKLWIVDLAGSEKVSKTRAVGQRLDEANAINASLTTLGRVIKLLADRQEHIPYREATITRIL